MTSKKTAKHTRKPQDPEASLRRLQHKQNDLTLQSLAAHAKEARRLHKAGNVEQTRIMLDIVGQCLKSIRF